MEESLQDFLYGNFRRKSMNLVVSRLISLHETFEYIGWSEEEQSQQKKMMVRGRLKIQVYGIRAKNRPDDYSIKVFYSSPPQKKTFSELCLRY